MSASPVVQSADIPAALGPAVRDLLGYRGLVRHLVRLEMRRHGADTFLGNLWWLLDPIIQVFIYTLVFSLVFERRTPDFPLFLFSAVLAWKWFSSSLSRITASVVGHAGLVRQASFPRLALPLATALASASSFIFALVPLLVLLLLMPFHLSLEIVWLPLVIVVQFLFILALAIPLAALNVFFRDLGLFIRHALLFLFFLSPVLWSFERHMAAAVDGTGQIALMLLRFNPLAVILESYRVVLYGRALPDGTMLPPSAPDFLALLAVALLSLLLILAGTRLFVTLERHFARAL